MGIREDVLALADELDGVSIKDDCDACLASGTSLCRGDLECAESAHKACAKRLRESVEHDAGEVTTMSAYDLLPDDDREALVWVREQGGLAAVEKRLMPEGMEWPTVDGKPVDFVTGYEPSLGALEAVSIYSNGACEVMGHDGIIKDVKEIHVATPKALDADGVEICVGDRLYDTDTGCGRTVRAVNDNGTVEFDGHENRGWFGRFLTHRAPVLAADGEPLEVGQTVLGIGRSQHEFEVLALNDVNPEFGDRFNVKCFDRDDDEECWCDPSLLTHQCPVLDADGEPLEVGDHVWWTWGGQEYVVEQVRSSEEVYVTLANGEFSGQSANPRDLTHQRPVLDADRVPIREGDTLWRVNGDGPFTAIEYKKAWMRVKSEDGHVVGYWPDDLTHAKPEPPDTWERIEEDALLPAGDYRERHGMEKRDGMTWPQQIREDLVRRCRALAERGER